MNKLITEEFENFLINDKGVSECTAISYIRDISRFALFLENEGIDIISATRNNILTYILSMHNEGRANA